MQLPTCFHSYTKSQQTSKKSTNGKTFHTLKEDIWTLTSDMTDGSFRGLRTSSIIDCMCIFNFISFVSKEMFFLPPRPHLSMESLQTGTVIEMNECVFVLVCVTAACRSVFVTETVLPQMCCGFYVIVKWAVLPHWIDKISLASWEKLFRLILKDCSFLLVQSAFIKTEQSDISIKMKCILVLNH